MPNPERAEAPSEYAEAVFRTLHNPVLTLNGDLTVQTANPAFYDLFQVDPDDTVGQRLYDLGNGQWDIPELRSLLEEVLGEREEVRGYRVDHEFETIGQRVMNVNATRLERASEPHHIILSIFDTTDIYRTRWELEAEKEYSDKIVDSIREGLLVLTPDFEVCSANKSFFDIFRATPEGVEGRKLYDLGNGQWDIPELRHALEEILPQRGTLDDFEIEHDFRDIGRRVVRLNARPLDHIERILIAIRDVTDLKKKETYQETLVRELRHRIKNIIASVRGLSEQTLSRSETLEAYRDAFNGRLDMLARTQEILTQQDETADIRDLLTLEWLRSEGDRKDAAVRDGRREPSFLRTGWDQVRSDAAAKGA